MNDPRELQILRTLTRLPKTARTDGTNLTVYGEAAKLIVVKGSLGDYTRPFLVSNPEGPVSVYKDIGIEPGKLYPITRKAAQEYYDGGPCKKSGLKQDMFNLRGWLVVNQITSRCPDIESLDSSWNYAVSEAERISKRSLVRTPDLGSFERKLAEIDADLPEHEKIMRKTIRIHSGDHESKNGYLVVDTGHATIVPVLVGDEVMYCFYKNGRSSDSIGVLTPGIINKWAKDGWLFVSGSSRSLDLLHDCSSVEIGEKERYAIEGAQIALGYLLEEVQRAREFDEFFKSQGPNKIAAMVQEVFSMPGAHLDPEGVLNTLGKKARTLMEKDAHENGKVLR